MRSHEPTDDVVVPVKTADQQAALMLVGMREALVRRRTQLTNSIRGYAAEFGLIAARGLDKIEPLLARIAADAQLPGLAKELFATQGREYARLKVEIRKIEAKLMAWHKHNELSRRLAQIPGIGPIGAVLTTMKVANPRAFRCGRDFSAWIGLTPKDHSTAGKTRHGVITRAGDEALRSVLVAGATAVVHHVKRGRGHVSPWLLELGSAQAGQARGYCAGQQERSRCLEADGQRGTLQSGVQPRGRTWRRAPSLSGDSPR